MKLRLFSMFSGFGGAEFALKNAGIDFECVGFSEIDKFAIKCYEQNHYHVWHTEGNYSYPHKNFGDCTQIDPNSIADFDLLTAGFPCQSFSCAGKQQGETSPKGTLFYDIIRIAEIKQPKYIVLENVKGLTFAKFKPTFDKILSELVRIGYNVKHQILNTKDYGVPQNRDRIIFVAIRKDLPFTFTFPVKTELQLKFKDILETDVDEKYYLSDKHVERLFNSEDIKKKFSAINPDIAITQTARQYANWKGNYVLVGNINPSGHGMNGNVYAAESNVSPTLTTNKGEGIKIINLGLLDSDGWEKRHECIRRIYSPDGISPTLPTGTGGGVIPKILTNQFRIRRLTPTECFRLQGFINTEINLEGISNSQQYKLAGNGWSINVFQKVFENLLKNDI
jgi:DNA (cytosine-5)-methyltransferase 1